MNAMALGFPYLNHDDRAFLAVRLAAATLPLRFEVG
jgi:hypothetical protein